ncbi:MAG: phenylalanine--tRNA ligase subunit alpha [Bacteriovoracaceae bacterium]|jgi:phenylalanyl-tRNA synthetase alpha chain|nr:phenylalanine--tRNA ligase subunit alpha [Bacteriovoracaceae bacterium]
MMQKLDDLFTQFQSELKDCKNKQEILNLKPKYLGKKGEISNILKSLKDATAEQRKEIGPKSNEVKQNIEQLCAKSLQNFEIEEINQKLAKNKIDITMTNSVKEMGLRSTGYHPVTLIQREVEDIFLSMGFEILDGPHIEDDYHNFEALNIPSDHPARDMQDTFWFKDSVHLLRTHTSTIQVRGMEMEGRKPPFKFVGPGKVFRCERTDASHEMVFHQIEGMMVGEDVSVSHLIYFMKTLLSQIFKKDVEVRLRPGFFPFVEPGFELDIKCLICGGKGCSVCKHTGWVELLPCGMVHPNVLKYGNIDTDKYNGFAFGLGLDRLVMMKYGIDDIRHLHGADLRFMTQFHSF